MAFCANVGDDVLAQTIKDSKLVTTDLSGFYEIPFTLAKDRKQTTYIRKELYEYRSIKVHEAFSLCYDSEKPPAPELVVTAFQKRFNIGGLILEKPSETQKNWRIRFRTEIPVDIKPTELVHRLEIIANTADTLEQEFDPTKKDGTR